MAKLPSFSFSKLAAPKAGVAVVFTDDALSLGSIGAELDSASDGQIARAFKAADFKGKARSTLDLVAPSGLALDRIVVVGLGKLDEVPDEQDWMKLGGVIFAKLSTLGAEAADIVVEAPTGKEIATDAGAAIAAGMKLRAYKFDAYMTKKDDDGAKPLAKVQVLVEDTRKAKKAWGMLDAVTDGTILARDLVNEPANVLGPEDFAKRAKKLEKLGVEVEILTDKDMKKLKMGALLGVAQGSARPARMAIMRWNGGKAKDAPVAFIGKGVVFDTGGISIKPAGGMEDMKGDMGGAAAVTGLMHAVAARKAKVNVVGVIGLVENMPDGLAQRPGDIVTSMSGQTIEVINTDAEGRLVLADALWYCQDRFKPRFMVNLATLTGACIVALGHERAGLFSNDDDLAAALSSAGETTGEKLWRMPLGKEYDKLIDTKNADMKNTGGRWAGSITAAQFLQRFVNDVPWAHLDVAGTAMGSPKSDISQGWASGFGVRLLDRLIAENYE
ncbi:leucyl aminopeptidase [Rhodobium gokarnense]|uniref:Probable cytosol aminopeptidase n=1 Tax=Rhodobium gokarnense TaxID=364296 RepID=A0ABT3HFK6_9HYPH|nr:leucyl aminopeptidase [Rhodobium gokarnense]MCW2309170.1 leucyl aminopeptidase [Rhodobium gokarnense]